MNAFQARAHCAEYLHYILSVTQAPSARDKLSTICIHQHGDNIKTSGTILSNLNT